MDSNRAHCNAHEYTNFEGGRTTESEGPIGPDSLVVHPRHPRFTFREYHRMGELVGNGPSQYTGREERSTFPSWVGDPDPVGWMQTSDSDRNPRNRLDERNTTHLDGDRLLWNGPNTRTRGHPDVDLDAKRTKKHTRGEGYRTKTKPTAIVYYFYLLSQSHDCW